MRWLAAFVVLGVVVRAATAGPGLVAMTIDPAPVVVATSDEPDDTRRVVEGKVTRIKALGGGVTRITVGRGPGKGHFQVGLPPRVKLPVRPGDAIRAELWAEGGTLHARVTDRDGLPLVMMNELPTGWAMAIGADTGRDPRGPRHQHLVSLTAPGGVAATFEGWVRGPVDGATYRIYGEAAVIDVKAAEAMGLAPTWTQSIWSGVVRER